MAATLDVSTDFEAVCDGLEAATHRPAVNPNAELLTNGGFDTALKTQMVSTAMISSVTVVVDRDNNVNVTGTVNIQVSIVGKGYVLQENVTIGFASAQAA